MIITAIYIISTVMLLACLIGAAYCLTSVSPIREFGSGNQLLGMCATIFFLIGVCLFGVTIFFVATHTNQVTKSFAEVFDYVENNPLVLVSMTISFPVIILIYLTWESLRN